MKMLSILICFIGTCFPAVLSLELEPLLTGLAKHNLKKSRTYTEILYGGYNTLQSDFQSNNFLAYGEMRGDAFYNNAFTT